MRSQTSSYQSSNRFMPLGMSHQPVKKALRLAPFEGWLVLFLLGVALYCVVGSIIGAGWVPQGGWLLVCPAVGLLIGLIVAKMPQLPQFILHLGACLVGHWLSVWLTSSIAFQVPWTLVLGDLRAAFGGQLGSMGASGSQVIFFFYLSFLTFFLGYFGSWLVYRAHLPWLVVLVYTSILLVNLNYVKDMTYLAIIMAAALLLLVARMQLVIRVVQWKHEGLQTDRQWLYAMKRRYMQMACVIVLLTIVLSGVLPMQDQNADGKAFWDRLNTIGTNVVSGHFSLQDLNGIAPGVDQANFFGDQLTLSNSVHLPTGEVLRYQASDKASHYLEGFTFNSFDGRTWTSSLDDTKAHAYQANDRLSTDPPNPEEQQITVSVTLPPSGTKSYIFAPPVPRLFSVPTVVYSDRTAGAWIQRQPLSAHETYQATFLSPPVVPTAPPLLSDGVDWRFYGLPEQYFHVPANLGPQVKQRALTWTKGAADTYTALKMLEKHLSDRLVFTYSLDNPPLPDNTDPISWLLQTRSGYCTYYATAMAIMARMLNIPTRMVNGFSQGRYDAASSQWVVRGDDAHSWVQAYFPNAGWINFDPTPTFSPSAVPPSAPHNTPAPSPSPKTVVQAPTPTTTGKSTSPTLSGNHPNDPPSLSTPLGGNSVLWVIGAILVFFIVIALLLVLLRYWWHRLYASSPLISAMYWRFCHVASFFGMAPQTSQTPYEYGQMIGQCFPQQARTFARLTDLYVREHWGGPQEALQGLQEAEVKALAPSLRTLLVNFFMHIFSRHSRGEAVE